MDGLNEMLADLAEAGWRGWSVQTNEGLLGLLSCPICGALVVTDPDQRVDRVKLHSDWHEHRFRIVAIREESTPAFTFSDHVEVVRGQYRGRKGKIVDMWSDDSNIHCYTIRTEETQRKLLDVVQDEIEKILPIAS